MIPKDTPAGKDNCGIVTTAMLAGVSYREAETLFLSLCGKCDYTTTWDRLEVMQHLGLTVLVEHHYGKKPSLISWLNDTYDPAFNYQVSMTGHVVALKDGLLFDQVFKKGVLPELSVYRRKHIHTYLKLGCKHDFRNYHRG